MYPVELKLNEICLFLAKAMDVQISSTDGVIKSKTKYVCKRELKELNGDPWKTSATDGVIKSKAKYAHKRELNGGKQKQFVTKKHDDVGWE